MAVRIGGQAVIEGVMMKNMDRYAVSVRKPNGKIETKVEECVSFAEKHPLFQLPVFRGMANFLESMVIGMKTLNYSASFYEDEEEQTESRTEQLLEKILGEKAEKIIMGIVLVFSLAISIGLFMILPYIASEALGKLIRNEYVILFMEGIIRIAIFLGYIVLISRMEDIKRVFMYHGAEHKTINCLEAGVPLTPENVDNFSRLHKRCGTSFIFIVMIISMVFFFFIRVDTIWLRIVLRLLFLPLVAGVSYEFIRLAGRSDNAVVNLLSKPGLWLQALTTREPDDSMLEVAIASVEAVFDWRDFLAHYEEEKPEEEGFEVVDVEDENDEILQALDRYLSVMPEAATAVKSGVGAMHDVTEGGIFGALWEMAEASGVGLEIDLKKIPIRQETVEICEFFDLNPYKLVSGGAAVMAAEDGNALVHAIRLAGGDATIVGKATDSNDRVLINGDERRFLETTQTDELW